MADIRKGLEEKIRRVRLLVLDVDGVMTDGGIIYDDSGAELKVFNVKDGHGLKLLQRGGVDVALITARESQVVLHRAEDLGIELVYQGSFDKVKALSEILDRMGIGPEEAAYVGDDVVDIPALRMVGFSAAVADAVKEVRDVVDYVTGSAGGRGAVREICELILKAKGRWEEVLSPYTR